MPASNVAPGATADSLAETYLRLIRRTAPGKPVRYVVLSHFHGDHLGGIRPFVKEGAAIVATAATRQVVERFVQLTGSGTEALPPPKFVVVSGRHVIADGQRALELLELPPNDHVQGMLVAHFPAEKLVYVADFFLPSSRATFPLPSHRPLMQFFVRWLDAQGLAPQRVITSHGSGEADAEHLAKVRALEEQN